MNSVKPSNSALQPEDARLAAEIARAFSARGESLHLVGGTVRDLLLDRKSPDLDFSTSALPAVSAQIVEELALGKPYRLGERFGTIAVRTGPRVVEITTYRTGERYVTGSRKPEVHLGATLEEDLRRRDFTINAMALDPLSMTLVDPLGGQADLEKCVIRAVGDPAARFEEDPLRLLRGVRIAADLEFTIEPNTYAGMSTRSGTVQQISRERVRDEFSKMLIGPRPVTALQLLRDTGLLVSCVPMLVELTRMPDHGPRHPLSLWDHTMNVVRAVQPDIVTRWAALLHDIAKPRTMTREPNGRPRFFGHEEVGAETARQILSGLRYPKVVIDSVSRLVESHMQLHAYSPEWSDGAVRRLALRLGPLVPAALDLVRADGAGHSLTGEAAMNAPKFDHLESRLHLLEHAGPARPGSPLSGDDLMSRYGRPPGAWIREVKSALENEVIEGHLAPDDRERAWILADALIGRLDAP